MQDDGGSGQAVEVLTISEDAEVGTSPERMPRSPGTPGVLATAHVRTKVTPPLADAAGLGGTYTIVRRFEFSAEKQRNVVVVRKPDGSLHVMGKGSPEMLRKLAGATSHGEPAAQT
jgi:magnesium-transporting ATPase (P-type)